MSEMFTYADWLQYREQKTHRQTDRELLLVFKEKTHKSITVRY